MSREDEMIPVWIKLGEGVHTLEFLTVDELYDAATFYDDLLQSVKNNAHVDGD